MSDGTYELATPENAQRLGGLARAVQKSMKRNKKAGGKGVKTRTNAAGTRQWEFNRESLSGMKEIGSGNFGKVYLAVAQGLIPGQEKTPVAVKTLTSQDDSAKDEFLSEVKIMQSIDGPHNIVRLLATCTDKHPLYMIMEFASRGDLKGVLKHARPRRSKSKKPQLTQNQLIQMAADAAEGMDYLSSMKVVHRDLAARNCLVHEDWRVCIGDFGISRDIYVREYYKMSAAAALPIRWMAPESLNDGVFATTSDIWSFGILLWEIMTFGMVPYPEIEDNGEVVEQVCDEEYRMAKPPGCPDGIYDLMMQCWEEESEDRPSFHQLFDSLKALIGKGSKAPMIAMDDDEGAAAAANLYDLPQDAIIRVPPPSEKEELSESWDPYGLAGIDVSAYGLVAAPDYTVAGGESYDMATPGRRDTEPDDSYDMAAARSPQAAEAAPTYDMASDDMPAAKGSPSGKKAIYSKHGMRNKEAQARVIEWIRSVTGAAKPDDQDFHQWLKSGIVLCELINKIKAKTIKKYNTNLKKMKAFHQMENLSKFVDACANLGVPASDRFDGVDLFEGVNLQQVVNCLNSLNKVAVEKGYLK